MVGTQNQMEAKRISDTSFLVVDAELELIESKRSLENDCVLGKLGNQRGIEVQSVICLHPTPEK